MAIETYRNHGSVSRSLPFLKEKPPNGYMLSGRRLAQIQATTRPDNLWPEIWIGMSKAAEKKEKQEWAIEKPKLGNARGLRGIYFNDPEDEECKEAIFKTGNEKVGDIDGDGNTWQNVNEEAHQQAAGNCKRDQRIQQNPKKQSMHASWNLSSLRASTQEFARACCKCMKVKAPGPLVCALLSLVTPPWITRGCGGSNPRHGSTLEADEYVDSVRFRLGCAGPVEPITCAACNSGILDTGAAHASCCALGEATRGHNAVSSLIHAAAQQCDHTSEMEVPGLIPSTDLRPADILTSALGNAYTALDVSICSPHASEAGVDCNQSRVQAKLEHYGPHLATLLRQNISYSPIVWSGLRATSPRHVGRFALSQQIHCAQTQHRFGRGRLPQIALQHHT